MRGTTQMTWLLAALLVCGFTAPAEGGGEIAEARKLLRKKDPRARRRALDLLVLADSRSAIMPLEDAIRRTRKDMDTLAKEVDKLDVEYMDVANSYEWAKSRGDFSTMKSMAWLLDYNIKRWKEAASVMRGHLNVVLYAGECMAKFQAPGAVAKIDLGAKNERDALTRQLYIQALGKTGRIESIPTLIKLLEHKDARIRSEAAEALRPFVLRKRVLAALKAHAQDSSWSARLSIYETMARAPFEVAVPFLVQGMTREQGQMAANVDALLHSLTGRTYHGDARGWAAWWKDNAKGIRSGDYVRPAPKANRDGDTVSTFFSIPVVSKNVLFVVDFSGSMDATFEVKDKHMQENLRRCGLPATRLGYAISEISKAVRELPDNARFNVIAYGDEAESFGRRPQKATKGTRERAVRWLRKRKTQWLTNIWGALDKSFGSHLDSHSGQRAFLDLPDTIIFLTDGKPTRGRFQNGTAIATLARLWNESAGAVIHTVGIGDGHDKDLLLGLAKTTHGFYVDLSKGSLGVVAHPRVVPPEERRPHFAREIKLILEQLKTGDWEARLKAVKRVAKLGPWGVPAAKQVGQTLADADSDVADAAVKALIAMGGAALQPALDSLSNEEEEVVIRALRVLRGIGVEAAPASLEIAKRLAHDDTEIVLAAARALRAIGPKAAAALEALKAIENHEDNAVQAVVKRAIESLSEAG